MKNLKLLIILIFISTNITLAQTNQIDLLLEKVNQTKSKEEKKELIKKLKEELSNKNKKAQEEANAIIKAKEKLPSKGFEEPLLNK